MSHLNVFPTWSFILTLLNSQVWENFRKKYILTMGNYGLIYFVSLNWWLAPLVFALSLLTRARTLMICTRACLFSQRKELPIMTNESLSAINWHWCTFHQFIYWKVTLFCLITQLFLQIISYRILLLLFFTGK